MNSKLFFADLDGTLLNDNKEISKALKLTLLEYMNRGNYLALSSGRPIGSVKAVAAGLDIIHPNLFCIGYNGGLIYHYDSDRIILEKKLDTDTMHMAGKIAEECGVYSHAYSDTEILIGKVTEELKFYRKTVKLQVRIIDNYPEGLSEASCKMLCISFDGADRLMPLSDLLMKTLQGKVNCVMSNERLLEVFPASSGKGVAVRELSEYLGISIADTFAAGDEQNDISMIEAAGHGIAMLNARDIVKESADIITSKDNNNDGLLEFFML